MDIPPTSGVQQNRRTTDPVEGTELYSMLGCLAILFIAALVGFAVYCFMQ